MTVNPGWGGQAFIESSIAKVARLRELLGPDDADRGGRRHRRAHSAEATAQAGATLFVAGSSIFGAADPAAAYREIAAAVDAV